MLPPLLPEQQQQQPIVIAEKTLKKGFMFGHISNGGGIIHLSHGKAIKIIASQEWVTLQLIEHGIGVPLKKQSWTKSKKVLIKNTSKKKDKEKPVEYKHQTESEDI